MIAYCGNCKFADKTRARRDGSTVPDALLSKEVRCMKYPLSVWVSEYHICADYKGNSETLEPLLKRLSERE